MTDAVLVLRHGERRDSVEENWRETAERIHDPGLTDRGRRQADRAAERLRETGVEEIYASPFLRAIQTASPVADALDLPVRVEPGLGEHLNPAWFDAHPEVLGREERVERFPRTDVEHRPLLEPTFPEDAADAERRIGETARRIVDSTSARRVLFVGHGATVGGVAHGLVGSAEAVDAPLCGLTELVRDGGGEGGENGNRNGDEWRVEWSGDVAHLDDGA
ncbi:histidine phosphatase family protein [Halogeometricum sp. S1BR25-6]|uniref:Histidine phosphatase family protein n=1 Tax=Halogeometricum salsisoli TaxID=2950536 RepID=A0ABU2GFB1_9EURY|nr:histidine phosphatase family protein [Halogeometricum sp. S1BR25-6]MDS0299029.1 histidine phosphatase family protein [Halogeometricum sp. S1BR25-6]